jgi:hypothetical protein
MLETQLRSWTPRRPSAGLERRIFGGAGSAREVRALLRVLLPAAACLILTVAMLNPPERLITPAAAGSEAITTLSLSNQSYAAYLPGSFTCAANRLDSFRWTNGGSLPSSTFSISPGKTND